MEKSYKALWKNLKHLWYHFLFRLPPFPIVGSEYTLSAEQAKELIENLKYEVNQAGAIDTFFNHLEILGFPVDDLLTYAGLSTGNLELAVIGAAPAQIDMNGGSLGNVIEALEISIIEMEEPIVLTTGYDWSGWGIAVNGNEVTHQPHWVLSLSITTIDMYMSRIMREDNERSE